MTVVEWTAVGQNVAIIAASCTAIYGISSWRREFIGRRRIELAEKALALFYEAKDVIGAIRNPLGHIKEGSSREPSPGETAEMKENLDRAFVASERCNKHIRLFSRIRSLRYRFVAVFGVAKSKPFGDLLHTIKELRDAAQDNVEQVRASYVDPEERKRLRSIMWWRESEDPMEPKLNAAIKGIEDVCEPILRKK